jgi:hypothetical protein
MFQEVILMDYISIKNEAYCDIGCFACNCLLHSLALDLA